MLSALRQHDLVREDDSRLMLTEEGLTYLARRDRAAVGLTLDRWSPEPAHSNPSVYVGTALRALASQMRHHAGVVGFAAALSAEVARSTDYDMWDLLPTSRSTIGYRYDRTTYAIHPDASFTLEYKGQWRPFLLEFERRATTPKRIPKRLKSYGRYFRSGWAKRDHGGHLPSVLFVFESPDNETAFLDIADEVEDAPIVTRQRRSPCRARHPGRRMDASAPALPRQTPPVPDVSGCPMTTFPVHDTSIRGCPSSFAGTTCGGDTSRISRYARPSTIRCRTHRSGSVVGTAHAARPYHSPATVPSYSFPAHNLHPTDIGNPHHAVNLSPEPFSVLPIGDRKGLPPTYRVSPQQIPEVQFVAEPPGLRSRSKTSPPTSLSTCSTLSTD